MKLFKAFSAVLIALAAVSCSHTEKSNVEFIPFQETEDGQWGMISMDGKVLFSEEFKNKPTIVRDGRFFVRSKDGVWEMYDATEKPKKIGADYAHTSGFNNGLALVAEKNKPVSIIDTDGKQVKLLDKIEGKEVDGVRAFEGPYAVFMTTDSLFGVIDMDGKCVVKPEYYSLNDYSDGKFVGVLNKYKDAVKKDKKSKTKISVIDAAGKVLFEFNGDKYENTQGGFSNGLLAVSVKKDGKETWGLINDKGEQVVKAAAKIRGIGTIHDQNFTYSNGDGWGLMNTKGETLIRAKYEYLFYDEKDRLIAVVKNGDSYEFKYVDEKDNQIGDDTYVRATMFSVYDGSHAIVKPNDKIYSIIDKNGKQLEGLPDIVNVGTYEGEDYIESDYVDINKYISNLKISETGLLGLSYSSTPQDGVALEVKSGLAVGNDKHKEGTPYWYDYKDGVWFKGPGNALLSAQYSGKLSRQTYKSKRVIDYDFGDYYYYHDEKTPTGYVWNKVSPEKFVVTISNKGRMRGKLRSIFNALSDKFKKMGTVAKQNNGAVIVELKNDVRAIITFEKDNIMAYWGKNLKKAKDIDIDKFKDASEEDDLTSISYGYLSNLFPDEIKVDTVAADTVAVEP